MAEDASKRVFIVDDSEDLLESLEMVLRERIPGITIDTFQQARQCLERARESPPALIVTDYFMPDMDGIEFAEKLLSFRPDLPVMIMSGYLDDKLATRMKRLPNIRVTHQKPLLLAEFVSSVRRLVQL
jgi:DNA-binding NtrC family response regulator